MDIETKMNISLTVKYWSKSLLKPGQTVLGASRRWNLDKRYWEQVVAGARINTNLHKTKKKINI